MADFGSALGSFGSGIQDFFSAKGATQDAASLDKAAGMEDVNARLAAASKDIQHAAASRDIYKVLGGQASDITSAGFSMSGSGLDLARSSAQQGYITQALIENQGQIDIQSHLVQAADLRAEAASSRNSAKSSKIGGFLQIGLGILSLFSDERLKENIEFIRVGKNGHRMYAYNYKADPGTRYVGYMAQEVERVEPGMVVDMGLKLIDSEYAPERING